MSVVKIYNDEKKKWEVDGVPMLTADALELVERLRGDGDGDKVKVKVGLA